MRISKTTQQALIDAALNEVSYGKFKSNIVHRNQPEQLHKAIREITLKLREINKIIDHTTRLKQEICEDENTAPYWKKTVQNISVLKETTNAISLKLNKLIQ